MANFLTAMNFIMENEGGNRKDGGLVNDPDDAGGITKYGISYNWWHDFDSKVTYADILNLTKEKAEELYKKHFWAKYKCDKIESDRVAQYFFDCCVNHGGTQGVKFLQRACNYNNVINLDVDGKIGAKTLEAANEYSDAVKDFNSKFLLNAMKSERCKFYLKLVKERPENKKFLDGWLSRCERG